MKVGDDAIQDFAAMLSALEAYISNEILSTLAMAQERYPVTVIFLALISVFCLASC
jgi:ABC-type dipeptide/oligopeptide/nickel transport system ATPase subunit